MAVESEEYEFQNVFTGPTLFESQPVGKKWIVSFFCLCLAQSFSPSLSDFILERCLVIK